MDLTKRMIDEQGHGVMIGPGSGDCPVNTFMDPNDEPGPDDWQEGDAL